MSDQMPTKLDMYNASVIPLIRGLENLGKVLVKTKAFATEKNISDETILNARLTLDMLPFKRQIGVVCDTAKGAAGRLAGVDYPSMEDNETTLDEVIERVGKVADYLKSVSPAGFENSETKSIVLKFGPNEFPFVGYSYLTGFVLPNFYFHFSIAYAILRTNGMVLGKGDYLGG
ncbi:MAG: hypothetical protein FD163_1961 [Hyphomonadaceae bacterium]|nr:MAG: hypothetical protein FD128_2197 [Hyphomonadaceae bacterium]KAF0184387.1 MAG: hypothetical protein FD163_1961 [Hyphomonadaceae bacterium]